MAFHFGKLKQTLRVLPSTKSIGFSTRVSEGDQTKNSHPEGIGTFIQTSLTPDICAPTSSSALTVCAVLRSPSDSDILSHLQADVALRPASLPAVCRHNCNLLPTFSDQDFLSEKDPVYSVVKAVKFTTDDILLHRPASFRHSSVVESSREQIPLDVLMQHCYHRFVHETFPTAADSSGLIPTDIRKHTLFQSSTNKCLSNLYYSAESGGQHKQKNNTSKDGPSPEQMLEVKEKLEQLVRNLFRGKQNYELLHQHVVLENNLFGDNKVSVGVTGYKLELLKLRLRIYAQLFNTSMEILSITTLEQTGVIRIHWRLKGLPQIQNLKFWRLFQSHQTIDKDDWEWLEAFSYFHIGKDGLVHKHRIDRMMPDNESQPDLTEKLRGLLNPAKPLVN